MRRIKRTPPAVKDAIRQAIHDGKSVAEIIRTTGVNKRNLEYYLSRPEKPF